MLLGRSSTREAIAKSEALVIAMLVLVGGGATVYFALRSSVPIRQTSSNSTSSTVSTTGSSTIPSVSSATSTTSTFGSISSTISSTITSATLSTEVSTAAPSAHIIGVRLVDGVGEFYNRQTGATFVPRGNNYVRLADQSGCGSPGIVYHSTFDPGSYDSSKVEQALAQMQQNGYNVVRVWINQLCVVDSKGDLSSPYLPNVLDFLQRAKANGIYVMFTIDAPPAQGYENNVPITATIGPANNIFLTQEGSSVEIQYWQNVITWLIDHQAPLDHVFAYELRNEAYFLSTSAPLNLTSGIVTTGNGQSYNMANSTDKQRMMDENLVYWIDRIRSGILLKDPTALVTIGFFAPQGPNPTRIGDPRVIRTYWAIADPKIGGSSADFIDLHPYPGFGLTLKQYVQNFEIDNSTQKPILMGEYGAFMSAYSYLPVAAQELQDWQVESCQYHFGGWLLWTWDSYEQPNIWNEVSGNQGINLALSPQYRPDPCAARPSPGEDIAFDKPVNASGYLPSNPPFMAVDGSSSTVWNSGAFAPQWIEIDLQNSSQVGNVTLVTSQSPNGNTDIRVWVKGTGTGGVFQLLCEFVGFTSDGQVLQYSPQTPLTGIQYVKVEIVSSPSWVSWREIMVFST